MTNKQKEKLEKRLKVINDLFNQGDKSNINSSELINEMTDLTSNL